MPYRGGIMSCSGVKSDEALCKKKVGISDKFIESSSTLNLGGSGQGNRGGAIYWHSHMEPLLLVYSKENKGFSFQDPIEVFNSIQWIVGYVDDNSLLLIFIYDQYIQQALIETHEALTTLEKLLQINGGGWL